MATEIWVNIGSGNGLLPHGTKPLPDPMLTIISENYISIISFKFPRGQWVNLSFHELCLPWMNSSKSCSNYTSIKLDYPYTQCRADSRFAPSQWETSLQSNAVSHWLGASLESALQFHQPRLVIRTFHHQGRCSRGGHLCNEHSEEKYSCSYK